MEENEIKYEKRWFLIHTYSGYEKKVKADLEKRVESLGLTDRVFRILVPEEEVQEEKRGKLVTVLRKIYPSYVMVEMRSNIEIVDNHLNYRVDSEAWYVIRNTNGVTGFLGVGSDSIPMTDDEVEKVMKLISRKVSVKYTNINIGDTVLIKDGAFKGMQAKVLDIDKEASKIKLEINTLGRLVAVDLNINMVEKEN